VNGKRFFYFNIEDIPLYQRDLITSERVMGIAEFRKGTDYKGEVGDLVDEIMSAGGTIAGGFVNSLLYPTYHLLEIPQNYKKEDYKDELEERRANTYDHADSEVSEKPIEGLEETVASFYTKEVPEEGEGDEAPEEGEENIVPKVKASFEIPAALQHYLIFKDGKLYRKIYRPSRDIDVFVIGKDWQKKANKITELLTKKSLSNSIYFSEFATSFNLGKELPSVQLIKRAYKNIEEILAGFDIDASRVALNEKGEIVAPQAYYDAVIYGINPVVPSRQSETFNYRLNKYYSKGFEPYFPGEVMANIANNPRPAQTFKHSYYELYAHRGRSSYKWNPKSISDYENNIAEFIRENGSLPNAEAMDRDQRFKAIEEGKLEVTRADVMRRANILMHDILSLMEFMSNQTSFEEDDLKNYSNFTLALADYVTSLYWRTIDPGIQLSGSFNPTFLDYLSGTASETKLPPLEAAGAEYNNILKLVQVLQQYKVTTPSIGDKLIAEFRGGKKVELSKLESKKLKWKYFYTIPEMEKKKHSKKREEEEEKHSKKREEGKEKHSKKREEEKKKHSKKREEEEEDGSEEEESISEVQKEKDLSESD
jgi:hypothetical protein